MLQFLRVLILFVFLLIINHLPMVAQLAIGPKIGINISTLTSTFQDDTSSLPHIGAQIGVFVNIERHSIFTLQPELTLSQRGETTIYENGFNRFTMNYAELFLLSKVAPIRKKYYRIFLTSGGYIGYWIFGTNLIKQNGTIQFDKYPINQDYDNVWDWGLNFGIGVSTRIFPTKIYGGHLVFETRYNLGLGDINILYIEPENYKKESHRVVSFYFGYLYDISGKKKVKDDSLIF